MTVIAYLFAKLGRRKKELSLLVVEALTKKVQGMVWGRYLVWEACPRMCLEVGNTQYHRQYGQNLILSNANCGTL